MTQNSISSDMARGSGVFGERQHLPRLIPRRTNSQTISKDDEQDGDVHRLARHGMSRNPDMFSAGEEVGTSFEAISAKAVRVFSFVPISLVNVRRTQTLCKHCARLALHFNCGARRTPLTRAESQPFLAAVN